MATEPKTYLVHWRGQTIEVKGMDNEEDAKRFAAMKMKLGVFYMSDFTAVEVKPEDKTE